MPRAFNKSELQNIRATLLRTGRAAAQQGRLRKSSIAELSRAAGISKGAFYRFFPSKEALYVSVLQEVETEIRVGLTAAAAEGLAPLLHKMFTTAADYPTIGALADPDELAWLMRGVSPEVVEANRANDNAYFVGLLSDLQERGEVRHDIEPEAFCALAPAALVLALGQDLIGPNRLQVVLNLLVEGLYQSLRPQPSPSPPAEPHP